jgi:hypothetical protein
LRKKKVIETLREWIGLGTAGILGLLWYDIRNIRKERDEAEAKMKKEYITTDTHALICTNVTSQFKIDIMNAKNEIISAIKENGACGRRERQSEKD